jgi:hypothetical protein
LAALRFEHQDHVQRCSTRRLERIDRLAASRAVLGARVGNVTLSEKLVWTGSSRNGPPRNSSYTTTRPTRRRLRSVFAATMAQYTKAYDLVLKECLAQPQRDQRHAADLQRRENELTDRMIETIATMIATGRAPVA